MKDKYNLQMPFGFRFVPSDQELIMDYLLKKKNDPTFSFFIINEASVYESHPEDLIRKYKRHGNNFYKRHRNKCEYFFSPRMRKYPNGSRPDRSAGGGVWKASGKDEEIRVGSEPGVVFGYKRSLVFYNGKPYSSNKTNWLMKEYITKGDPKISNKENIPMQLDEWVLCKIYKVGRRKQEDEEEEESEDGEEKEEEEKEEEEEEEEEEEGISIEPLNREVLGSQGEEAGIVSKEGERSDLEEWISIEPLNRKVLGTQEEEAGIVSKEGERSDLEEWMSIEPLNREVLGSQEEEAGIVSKEGNRSDLDWLEKCLLSDSLDGLEEDHIFTGGSDDFQEAYNKYYSELEACLVSDSQMTSGFTFPEEKAQEGKREEEVTVNKEDDNGESDIQECISNISPRTKCKRDIQSDVDLYGNLTKKGKGKTSKD